MLRPIRGGGGLPFPSLSEARLGHLKAFKVPSLNDYKKFTKGYEKHLALLDRRSEKAYRKSFLKFVAVEDELLYTLCDSNEFRANALMRSAAASFGKMEADRNTSTPEKSSLKAKELSNAVLVSQELIPEIDGEVTEKAIVEHETYQHKFASQKYTLYMQDRVRLYKRTFRDGTKKQKRLFRKLRKRAMLWQSFKDQDETLISKFTDDHLNIIRSIEATPNYKSPTANAMDYSGTHIKPNAIMPAYNRDALLGKLQEKVEAAGILTSEQVKGAKNIADLFNTLRQAREASKDTSSTSSVIKPDKKDKAVKINTKTAKRFWDRLYGGVNFDWENSTGYYPDGLGITLTGGYHISDNSGLNIEAETLLNGSKMGFSEDLRFESTLISNYTLGANIDYRVWKFFYAGIGAECIINTIEVPAVQLYDALEHTDYTLGLPLTAKAILPIGGSKSTQVQFSYDLNSQHNIKPKFDFKVGFLIGR